MMKTTYFVTIFNGPAKPKNFQKSLGRENSFFRKITGILDCSDLGTFEECIQNGAGDQEMKCVMK